MTTEQFPARGEYAPGSLGYIKRELADARDLLAAIRDDEVNAQDEADKFLRDNKFSALHAALEEIERLKARVRELRAALLSILSAKRYDPNRGRGSEGQFVTMNIKTEIVAQADAAIDAARFGNEQR